jgi:glutamate formiminotransferase
MQSRQPILVAVPNVSEGRDRDVIDAIGLTFARHARLLDVHSDPDHGRSVYTIAAPQGQLAHALVEGARAAIERIDLAKHDGQHPHVGAIDVAPVVYLDDSQHGPACAEALTAAALIGDDLELPVFLYGELAQGRERAEIRSGGVAGLRRRGTVPDFGPREIDPQTGAVLVAARPPLIAFNLNLATDDVQTAKRIASEIRESAPKGLKGVRAIGLRVSGKAQVSTNVHDYRVTPLPAVLERVEQQAPVEGIEFVGLPPEQALKGMPTAGVRTIENALGSASLHGSDQEEAPPQ